MATNQTAEENLDRSLELLREMLEYEMTMLNLVMNLMTGKVIEKEGGAVLKNVPPEFVRVIPLILQGAGSSCHTLLHLCKGPEMSVRDLYPVARSVIEGIINAVFILASGPKEAVRAEKHALQRTARNLDRKSTIGDFTFVLKWSASDQFTEQPKIKDAIAEFTSKSGSEMRSWTKASVPDRLACIGEKFGIKTVIPLHGAYFAIYADASEITHGTYFGTLFFLGMTQPGATRDVQCARKAMKWHEFSVFTSVVFAIEGLMKAVSIAFELPKLHENYELIRRDVAELPIFQDASARNEESGENKLET